MFFCQTFYCPLVDYWQLLQAQVYCMYVFFFPAALYYLFFTVTLILLKIKHWFHLHTYKTDKKKTTFFFAFLYCLNLKALCSFWSFSTQVLQIFISSFQVFNLLCSADIYTFSFIFQFLSQKPSSSANPQAGYCKNMVCVLFFFFQRVAYH